MDSASRLAPREVGRDPSPRLVPLIAVGAFASVVVWVAASGSPKLVLVATAGLLAAAVLACLVIVARPLIVPLLLFVWIGLMSVPVATHLWDQEHVGGWPGIRISAADLAMALLFVLGALGLATHRVKQRLPILLLWLFAAMIGQYCVSAIGAPNRQLALFEIASVVHSLVIALIAASLFRPEFSRTVYLLVAAQVCVHTAFAIAQRVTGQPVGAGWLVANVGAVQIEELASGATRLRPSGLFANAIVYANFLMLSLPLLVAGVMGLRVWWVRLTLAAAVLIGLSGLVITLSRGAWFSSLFAATVLVAAGFRHGLVRLRHILIAGLVAAPTLLAGGVLFAPQIYERLTQSASSNLQSRFELNEVALRMIAAHPVAGVGVNNFVEVMRAYDPKNVAAYFAAPAHNLYLLEAAESGLPGAACLVALFAAVMWIGWRRLRQSPHPASQWLVIGVIAGLSGLLLSQVADFSYRIEPLRSVVWLYIGLMFGAVAPRHSANHPTGGAQ